MTTVGTPDGAPGEFARALTGAAGVDVATALPWASTMTEGLVGGVSDGFGDGVADGVSVEFMRV
jgi:hypothetical protein